MERGEISDKAYGVLVPELYGPDGRKQLMWAAVNLSISPSLVGPEFIQMFGLQPSGEDFYYTEGGRTQRVAQYNLRIKFGDYDVATTVVPSSHGSPACILGGDFFQKALNGQEHLIHELIMPEHYRVLANAARCKKKYVLITGKYGEQRTRLDQIKNSLKSLGFVGLILDEYPDIEEQPLTEKMVTCAALSRFVIVDDHAPSGHINELGICHERKFVTAVLRLEGKPATAMQADIGEEVSFLRTFDYADDADLNRAVVEAAKWANETVEERSRRLNRMYSAWRSPHKIMR